jgi:hypothetical protein
MHVVETHIYSRVASTGFGSETFVKITRLPLVLHMSIPVHSYPKSSERELLLHPVLSCSTVRQVLEAAHGFPPPLLSSSATGGGRPWLPPLLAADELMMAGGGLGGRAHGLSLCGSTMARGRRTCAEKRVSTYRNIDMWSHRGHVGRWYSSVHGCFKRTVFCFLTAHSS